MNNTGISYELAKKLKDAGFPKDWTQWDEHDGELLQMPESWKMYGPGYSPTLSELIEACGDEFHCLVHATNGGMDSDRNFWSAGTSKIVSEWKNGSTPEIAVANLYLELHK